MNMQEILAAGLDSDCDCNFGLVSGGYCTKCESGRRRARSAQAKLEKQQKPVSLVWEVDPVLSLPKKYRNLNWETFDAKAGEDDQKLYGRAVAEKFGKNGFVDVDGYELYGLFLYGEQVGAGKTGLACLAALEYARAHNQPIEFLDYYDLLGRVGSMPYEQLEARIVQLCDCPILVLDDLGNPDRADGATGDTAKETARRIEVAGRIINHRTMEEMFTIVTSNLPIFEGDCPLRQQWGDRIYSRILGDMFCASMGGRDMRIRKV